MPRHPRRSRLGGSRGVHSCETLFVKGQYTDAEGKCRVEALLFEEFGAMSAGVEELLMRVAEVAGRRLT